MRIAPDLDAARVCLDDLQIACVHAETLPVFERRPDEPTVYTLLFNAAMFGGEDPRAVAADLMEHSFESTLDPSRRELMFLNWWALLFSRRLRDETPSKSLADEQRALLAALEGFEPLTAEDDVRRKLMILSILRAQEHPAGDISEIAADLAECDDPVVLNVLVRSLTDASDRGLRLEVADRLVRSEPTSPRYGSYLISAALAAENPSREATALMRGGFGYPDAVDDLLLLSAWRRPEAPPDPRMEDRLGSILLADRAMNTSEVAAVVLARMALAQNDPRGALRWIREFERTALVPSASLLALRSTALGSLGRHEEAALVMLESLRRGGPDYERWYLAARHFQRAGDEAEAIRLYQYYLTQLDLRAAGVVPFGPPAPPSHQTKRHLKVWGHLVQLQPSFFGRSAVHHLLELLAITAAGVLAAARIKRASAFIVPAALAAEIVFFAGVLALRGDGTPWAEIGVVSWLWLMSAVGRTFVLVGGGLYLSAGAGLPRRARRYALPFIALASAGAGALGWRMGFPDGPIFVVNEMSAEARVAELGLAPDQPHRSLSAVGAVVRAEAAGRLVWPAVILGALAAITGTTMARRRSWTVAAAVAIAAALGAAGSGFAFPLAFAGGIVLGIARVRAGALAPFALHLAFVAGSVVRLWGGGT